MYRSKKRKKIMDICNVQLIDYVLRLCVAFNPWPHSAGFGLQKYMCLPQCSVGRLVVESIANSFALAILAPFSHLQYCNVYVARSFVESSPMDFADKEMLNRYDSMAVVTPDKGKGKGDRPRSPIPTKVRGVGGGVNRTLGGPRGCCWAALCGGCA
jgi:hypothetical protein